MKLTFLGTRGEIEARTRRHRMHTSLLISYRGTRVMIDCGLDGLGKLKRVGPTALALTHAHPDHAWGLRNDAPFGTTKAVALQFSSGQTRTERAQEALDF